MYTEYFAGLEWMNESGDKAQGGENTRVPKLKRLA